MQPRGDNPSRPAALLLFSAEGAVTLLLAPVLFSIFVLDLKLIRWEAEAPAPASAEVSAASDPAA